MRLMFAVAVATMLTTTACAPEHSAAQTERRPSMPTACTEPRNYTVR
jgi:hypothetical protein